MRPTLLALAVVMAGVAALWGFGPFGEWKIVVLRGHSMEPAVEAGSLLFVREIPKDQLNVGDIVLFSADAPLETNVTVAHRVQRIVTSDAEVVAFTKGDANAVADPTPRVFQRSAPRVEFILAHGQTFISNGLRAGLVALGLLAYLAMAPRVTGFKPPEFLAVRPHKPHLLGR